MLIDSHNHVGYCGKSDAAVVQDMDELGIDVTWLLTWHLPVAEDNPGYHFGSSPLYARDDGTHASMPLDGVLRARDRFPTRFVAGYCPGPEQGDAAAHFAAAARIHGVRVCGEWSYRMGLDDPRALELFHAAGQLKAPVILHMDVPYLPDGKGNMVYQKYWHGGTVDNLERALQACPETIFVGHGPGFWREISGDAHLAPSPYPPGPLVPGGKLLPLFARYPHLWADLSAGSGLNALRRNPTHAREFILRYQDRLLYARDGFGNALREFLPSLKLPAAVLRKIFSGNAMRLVPAPAGAPGAKGVKGT